MSAVGRAKVTMDLSATMTLPVINPPTMKHDKVDDRNRRPIPQQRRDDDSVSELADALWPTPAGKPEAEMTDAEVAARLGDIQQILDREVAAQVVRVLNTEPMSSESRNLLRVALRRLIESTLTKEMAGDVMAITSDETLTATAKLVAVRAVIDFHTRQSACPMWCSECYPNPDGDAFKMHRHVVGRVEAVNPDNGSTTVYEVAVERADETAFELGRAYVRVGQVEGGDNVLGGPRAVAKLIRLLVKAQRILRADRKEVRAMRKLGPLSRAIAGMSGNDLRAFRQSFGDDTARSEGDAA